VGKDKLRRWVELAGFERVIQPGFEELFRKDHYLKGHWRDLIFKNKNPVILELGCGKGEYTVGLAREFPQRNFIGIDIKGARMWKGAKTANQEGLHNVAFLRTRIELIGSLFDRNEVEEIWITFPDPRIKKRDTKRRLISARFLNLYKNFLCKDGILHLKTDNFFLFQYTRQLLKANHAPVIGETCNLYARSLLKQAGTIQTFYEQKFLEKGQAIYYLKFLLPEKGIIEDLSHT